MYKIVKQVLFLFNPESVHNFTFKYFKIINNFPGIKHIIKSAYKIPDSTKLKKTVFGIEFKHPVGLAAGLDKNAEAYDILGYMGFSFVEIGTVTPKPQEGNPKPRLFRLTKDKSLLNRMGFNNEGMETVVKRLKKKKSDIIIGGNIGKNKITPNEEALYDYEKCFNNMFNYVDYFVVNVSSPNTPNLRDLQEKEPLTKLLLHLQSINSNKDKRKPILLKIAPDLTNTQLDDIIDIVKDTKIDGVVATNTTIDRTKLTYNKDFIESLGAGGGSGAILTKRSTEIIKYLNDNSKGAFPIIGVGGIMNPKDAIEKLEAGASLIQLYSGFIYEGPGLIKSIVNSLINR